MKFRKSYLTLVGGLVFSGLLSMPLTTAHAMTNLEQEIFDQFGMINDDLERLRPLMSEQKQTPSLAELAQELMNQDIDAQFEELLRTAQEFKDSTNEESNDSSDGWLIGTHR